MTKYKVIRDTREHKRKGWIFSSGSSCAGTINKVLETGDYTIDGYETILSIERKGSITEFARNVCEKRFDRELERLNKFQYAYLLLEFDMDDLINYPDNTHIPLYKRKYIKIRGHFLIKKILEYQVKYPHIHILFCGKNSGKNVATSIFKRVLEDAKDQRTD